MNAPLHTLAQAQTQAQDLIQSLMVTAQDRYGVAPSVTLLWNLRGMVGGHCQRTDGHCTIRFNAHIATHEGEAYKQTIAHEYAHAVAFTMPHVARGGSRPQPHGALWQGIMLAFGYPPRRCHSYQSAEPARKLARFIYLCNCREHKLTSIRHNKILAGSQYRCGRCATRLTIKP